MDIAKTNPPQGRYLVRVADNFQYMDSSEWYELGRFAALDEAIEASCKLVTRWLEASYKPGMTATDLYDSFVMFGDDPFITDTYAEMDADELEEAEPDAEATDVSELPEVLFSAWQFAKRMAPVVVAMQSAAARS